MITNTNSSPFGETSPLCQKSQSRDAQGTGRCLTMDRSNLIDVDTAFSIADWEVFQDRNGRCWAAIPKGDEFRVVRIRSLAFAEEFLDLLERLMEEDRPICLVKGMLGLIEEFAQERKLDISLATGENQ
ncbi:hypothetical protein CCP3SC15_530014 [Gammaproteobacteria bacterium]